MKKIKFVNNSSPDLSAENLNQIQDNVEEEIQNLEIGGRNLLLDSKREIRNSSYIIAEYTLAEVPVDEQEYTLTLKGSLGEGKTAFRIFNSGGSVNVTSLVYDNEKDIYKSTFNWKSINSNGTTADNTFIRIYAANSSVTSESSIEWVKLEKGNKNTDWMPAPEDIDKAIGTLSSLTSSDKTSLVNAINELRLISFSYMRGQSLADTTILTNKTFDGALNLGFSSIFTINGNEEVTNGDGFPQEAYKYGLLITFYSYATYAKTQIYITDGNRGIYWRNRLGGSWNCIKQHNITTGTEFATDEYIDNKRVYRKRVNCGALPNATAKSVAHGLSNVTFVKPPQGLAKNSNGTVLTLPYSAPNGVEYSVALSVNNTNIQISAGNDRSAYTECYVDLYYTKK